MQRARGLAETLAWLRLCAVAGQALTVFTVVEVFGMPINLALLAFGIGALALFAAFAFWRLRKPWPVTLAEAFAHVSVDILVLAALLFVSGGATNPFVSLLVMPIALVAAALPLRYVAAVVLLASTCYLALIPWHLPLPSLHASRTGDFDLHVAGMTVNFVVTAAMLAFFIARLARALREREDQIQHERERALRDEGILAIATQAAGTAHELNTPLSTIRTLLAELRREHSADAALAADLALLTGQAERCRDILRELVAVGRRQLDGHAQPQSLAALVADCEHQFHLLRPETALKVEIEAGADERVIHVAPDLRLALLNLLSNAADASLANGAADVVLYASAGARFAEFGIRDHGAGIAPGSTGIAFQSSKGDGLGLGLALAHATAERLGGDLIAQTLSAGGLLQRLRIPLDAADNRAP